ncbi:MAG: ATP-binding cassette domain-containing protein [Eubacteriales bacterium]
MAGKSTLIKIINGIYHRDEGEILFDGKLVNFSNP